MFNIHNGSKFLEFVEIFSCVYFSYLLTVKFLTCRGIMIMYTGEFSMAEISQMLAQSSGSVNVCNFYSCTQQILML